MRLLFTFIFVFFSITTIVAQSDTASSSDVSTADKTQIFIEKAFKYSPLPFAGYATETGMVIGVTKYNAFKFKGNTLSDSLIQPSSILAYVYFTQENQYKYYLITDLMNNDNKINSKFEFMFMDYPSYFFGLGNNNDFDSAYLVDFKNILFAPSVSYNIFENIYIGAKYTYNDYLNIASLDENINDSVLQTNSGLQSGVGIIVSREARDNRIRAKKGSYFNMSYDFYDESMGSEFNYNQFTLDYRYYITPIKQITIASQLYTTLSSGNVPVQSMPVVGGAYRMRGIYEARYRDKNMIMAQFELRFPIYWILYGATYVGLGQVAPRVSDFAFNSFHYGYGAGLRLLIDEKTSSVLRFDLSYGPSGSKIFIGFNEAF